MKKQAQKSGTDTRGHIASVFSSVCHSVKMLNTIRAILFSVRNFFLDGRPILLVIGLNKVSLILHHCEN